MFGSEVAGQYRLTGEMLRASIGEAAARSGLASARKVREVVRPAAKRNAGRRKISLGSQADRPAGHIASVVARHLHSHPSSPRGGNPGIRFGVHEREAPAMKSYRLLLLDSKGRLLGSRSIECMTDAEAIALAERESGIFALIEIWRGGDPVGMFTNPRAGEVFRAEVCAVRTSGPAWSDLGLHVGMLHHRSRDRGGYWLALG